MPQTNERNLLARQNGERAEESSFSIGSEQVRHGRRSRKKSARPPRRDGGLRDLLPKQSGTQPSTTATTLPSSAVPLTWAALERRAVLGVAQLEHQKLRVAGHGADGDASWTLGQFLTGTFRPVYRCVENEKTLPITMPVEDSCSPDGHYAHVDCPYGYRLWTGHSYRDQRVIKVSDPVVEIIGLATTLPDSAGAHLDLHGRGDVPQAARRSRA